MVPRRRCVATAAAIARSQWLEAHLCLPSGLAAEGVRWLMADTTLADPAFEGVSVLKSARAD